MTDFVRVSLDNGMEASLSAAFAEGAGLDVLDAPATNSWGRPLPASRKNGRRTKPRTTVKQAATKKAATSTTTGGAAADSPEEGKA